MIRGVSFEIPQTMSDALWGILGHLNVAKYYWYNIESQTEVWAEHEGDFFNKGCYDGESFSKCIRSPHYIVFLKLQAYLSEGKFYDIHTYDEFLKSDSKILLLVYDCAFVEIYLKDQDVANIIYQSAEAARFKAVQYITKTNDLRVKMDVR